jgi:hypothetical protein
MTQTQTKMVFTLPDEPFLLILVLMKNITNKHLFQGLSRTWQNFQNTLLILLVLLSAKPLLQAQGGDEMPTDDTAELLRANSHFLRFAQNIGQFPEPYLRYRATDAQATYYFTKNEIRSVVASAKDSMRAAYALQFIRANGETGFKLGKYDFSFPLVIDPIALKWSTYLMQGPQNVYDISVHPTTGRIYIVGSAKRAAFPNTLGRPFGGVTDAFVTYMGKNGTTLLWSTFLGGSASYAAHAVSVDAVGEYI